MNNGISVSGLENEYLPRQRQGHLNFTVTPQRDLAVTNTLYDHGGAAKRVKPVPTSRTAARASPWR